MITRLIDCGVVRRTVDNLDCGEKKCIWIINAKAGVKLRKRRVNCDRFVRTDLANECREDATKSLQSDLAPEKKKYSTCSTAHINRRKHIKKLSLLSDIQTDIGRIIGKRAKWLVMQELLSSKV